MADKLKLPVGIEDFREIRRKDFYYIDKTGLIEQLLDSWGKVNLFTRPRRFGKTLNMSMLRYFFETGTDKTLFEGLHISQRSDLCEEYMGKFPVVSLTLKGVDGLTFERAKNKLLKYIALEAERFNFLKNSDKLTDNEKQRYGALIRMQDGKYVMDEDTLESALQTLSELLYRHYGQKVIILIDEYDVPLDKAYQNDYYREMIVMIRSLFGEALKTNEFLQFAVLTGCLRVSKESIFTGLNNFKIFSITDLRFDEQFGFTEDEVEKMLKDYQLETHLASMKEWYDGYRFGDADIYCPWDVINRVDDLCDTPEAEPKCYWINSSGNALVKRFVSIVNRTTQNEIERLIAGEPIEKSLRLDLTYDEIDKSIDNIWSVLFTTGYLTQVGMTEQGAYKLVIPNKEVRTVYISQIQEWFKQKIADNAEQMTSFWKAVEDGNAEEIEQYLNRTLSNTISVFDTKAPEKENSYHTFLAGMLTGNTDWVVKSNVEAGEGFADIIIEPQNPDDGIIFELKYSKEASGLDKACERAIKQIRDRRYFEYLKNDGRYDMMFYGIAFYKKRCKVVVEKMKEA
ncbi:AAA family ATPase [Coprococcus catus]|uniref:AAA family ATPase n=1 Tax=Coprococcus catus TaxID=116085 RepID=UPI001C8CDA47|nr:AAA family ATPase [Coprococcus catus]MBX9230881.1 AAA family ATPase [Coprococcus catus]MCT6799890.1 AAA family ATPase [Coprococcus catus]